MKAWILLIVSPTVLAQTAYTNCYSSSPNNVQCTTTQPTPPPTYIPPRIAQPDIAGNVLRGQQAGLQIQQMRLQNEMLRQQLQMLQEQRMLLQNAELDRQSDERRAREESARQLAAQILAEERAKAAAIADQQTKAAARSETALQKD